MDPPRELAQLLERASELVAGGVEQPAGRHRIDLELAPREPELQRQRHQPLLGAVVEVALEASALEHRDLHEPRPRAAEVLEARVELGLEALVVERERRRGGGGADQPALLAERRVVDDRADEPSLTRAALAVGGANLGDRAVPARLG